MDAGIDDKGYIQHARNASRAHVDRLLMLSVGSFKEGLEMEREALEGVFAWFYNRGVMHGEMRTKYYMEKNARTAAAIREAERITSGDPPQL